MLRTNREKKKKKKKVRETSVVLKQLDLAEILLS